MIKSRRYFWNYACLRMGWTALLIIALAYAVFADYCGAETIAEFDPNRFVVVDSLAAEGEIARPQLCPVDSTWLAYEIHRDGRVQLVVYNIATGQYRLVNPAPINDSIAINQSLASGINRDLAWRPVPSEGRLWAAYVSDSSGTDRIYLYDVLSGNSFGLIQKEIADSGAIFEIWGVPDWSPDGKCLTYAAKVGNDADVYILCDMDGILGNLRKMNIDREGLPLIKGVGNQFGAIWCPVQGTGYLAFTEQGGENPGFRIKVFDILTSKTFGLVETDTTLDYFSPTWNAGGNRISFYRYDRTDGPLTRYNDQLEAKFEVGVATVSILQDSLILMPECGGNQGKVCITEVAPNFDKFLGPAWMSGGRLLALARYDEVRLSRLSILSLTDWEEGEMESDYWLRGFGGDMFDSPRDFNIVNRNISFSYESDARKYLVTGQVAPSLRLVQIPEYLEIGDNRLQWWAAYSSESESGGGSLLTRVGNFLWAPIAGPDIGINKRIVPIAGGAVLLAVLLGGGDDGSATNPRDWTLPQFPKTTGRLPGFQINMGF